MTYEDPVQIKHKECLELEVNNLIGPSVDDLNKILREARDFAKKYPYTDGFDYRAWVREKAKRYGYKEVPYANSDKKEYQGFTKGMREFKLLKTDYVSPKPKFARN
jgi:hypothetical protein